MGLICTLSWIFVPVEFDNYERVIHDNIELKSLVDSALPVRDQIPNVLSALATCPGDTCEEVYDQLYSVYDVYMALTERCGMR